MSKTIDEILLEGFDIADDFEYKIVSDQWCGIEIYAYRSKDSWGLKHPRMDISYPVEWAHKGESVKIQYCYHHGFLAEAIEAIMHHLKTGEVYIAEPDPKHGMRNVWHGGWYSKSVKYESPVNYE